MKLQQVYEQFAAKHGLEVITLPGTAGAPNSLGIMIHGEFGDWAGYAMCFEEENLFVFFINLGIHVPRENRGKITKLLNDLNYNLKFGGFYLDAEEGYLIARATQYVFGSEEDYAWQVENCIKVCAVIADAYYKQIMKTAFGD